MDKRPEVPQRKSGGTGIPPGQTNSKANILSADQKTPQYSLIMYSKKLEPFLGKIFEIHRSIWNPEVLCQHKVLLLSLGLFSQHPGFLQEGRGPSLALSSRLRAWGASSGEEGGLSPHFYSHFLCCCWRP